MDPSQERLPVLAEIKGEGDEAGRLLAGWCRS